MVERVCGAAGECGDALLSPPKSRHHDEQGEQCGQNQDKRQDHGTLDARLAAVRSCIQSLPLVHRSTMTTTATAAAIVIPIIVPHRPSAA
jgi:hypothetical protein